MISEFGIYIRKIRKNESIISMASKLGVAVSFLSAIEVGKETIPMDFSDKICQVYRLNKKQKEELIDSIVKTNTKVFTEPVDEIASKKNSSIIFARKVNTDSDLLNKLKEALANEKG